MSGRHVSVRELSELLGISRRTISYWCKNDPELAILIDGQYMIRLSELAKRPGMDDVAVLLLDQVKWTRATDVAKVANWSRQRIWYFCRKNPRLARRIGSVWYIDTTDYPEEFQRKLSKLRTK